MVFIHAVLHYFNYGRAPYYNALLGKGVYPATPKEAGWGYTYGGYGLTGQVCVTLLVAPLRVARVSDPSCVLMLVCLPRIWCLSIRVVPTHIC